MKILTYTIENGEIMNVMLAPNKYSEQDIKGLIETYDKTHPKCKGEYRTIDDELGKAIQFLLDDRATYKYGLVESITDLKHDLNSLANDIDEALELIRQKLNEEEESEEKE